MRGHASAWDYPWGIYLAAIKAATDKKHDR